ncbi:uncharacterized protein JCM15063_006417 [Sporobolomyces koalae]|uniref:uncharacterized protein n=1 Tax=Sporobolomyces koalae TaxID=500713 RepID=UPI00317A7DCB
MSGDSRTVPRAPSGVDKVLSQDHQRPTGGPSTTCEDAMEWVPLPVRTVESLLDIRDRICAARALQASLVSSADAPVHADAIAKVVDAAGRGAPSATQQSPEYLDDPLVGSDTAVEVVNGSQHRASIAGSPPPLSTAKTHSDSLSFTRQSSDAALNSS